MAPMRAIWIGNSVSYAWLTNARDLEITIRLDIQRDRGHPQSLLTPPPRRRERQA